MHARAGQAPLAMKVAPGSRMFTLWSKPTLRSLFEDQKTKTLRDTKNVYYIKVTKEARDIYEKIIYENFNFTTLATIIPQHKDRILTVNGVSKAYSMTGWRIGYAGASKEIIKSMAKIQSQSTTNPSSISQYAALEALKGEEEFILKNNQVFKKRRDLISNIINQCKGLSVNIPSGAFYIFPSCANLIGLKTKKGEVIENDSSFCEYLIEEVGVAVVPGIAFGKRGFFRISYATSDEILLEAGKRIKAACDKLD